MRSIIGALLVLMILGTLFVVNTSGAMSQKSSPGVITSSGTTVVTLPFQTTEIWFVKVSTDEAYISLVSTTPTNGRMLRSTKVVSDTVEVKTTKFSVKTTKLPFLFYYEARGW
jgi:hypothetical protein